MTDTAQIQRDSVAKAIQALFQEKLSLRVAHSEADLFETGVLDSMTLVELILNIEQQFGLTLPLQDLNLDSFRSVNTIAQLVSERVSVRSSVVA